MNVMTDLCQFLCLFKAGLRASLAVPTEQLWNKQLLSYSRYPLPPADTWSPCARREHGNSKYESILHGRQDAD